MSPRIGETVDEYSQRAPADDEVWVKGFKEGETRIRILQNVNDWTTYQEHYSEELGYFPCCGSADECVGCQSRSDRTKSKSRRYAFNALDENGRLNVFKMGGRLYRTFKAREQRIGSITDRDYTIIRIGKSMNDTTYDLDAGDSYEIDAKDIPELHDIPAILGEKYDSVSGMITGDGSTAEDEPKASKAGGKAKASKAGGKAKTSKAEADEAQNTTAADSAADEDTEPEADPYAELSNKELRECLEKFNGSKAGKANPVEFNERTPRALLLASCRENDVPTF